MKQIFFSFFVSSLLLACLTGCVSPLMSENQAERMAAVDSIINEQQLANIAWDCDQWFGLPKQGYPMDVRLRALDKLTDVSYLAQIAAFAIVDYTYDYDAQKSVKVTAEQIPEIREKALAKLMTKEGAVAVLKCGDADFLKIYASYADKHGKNGLVADNLVELLVDKITKPNPRYTHRPLVTHLNQEQFEVYAKQVSALAMMLDATPQTLSRLIRPLKAYDFYEASRSGDQVLKLFRDSLVVHLEGKVTTAEQARCFYPIYQTKFYNEENPFDQKQIDRMRELIIADNVALLRNAKLEDFRTAYGTCPVSSAKYFSPEILTKIGKEKQASQFIGCFTEPVNSEFKLGLAIQMGALDYLKNHLGNFDLGTKLKSSDMTLLEIALRSGETGIADYLWETGSPAPRFNSASFWAGVSTEAAVAATEWIVKKGVKKDKTAATPEMCFEAALMNGNTKVADALRAHFGIKPSKRLDAYVLECVNNAKMPSELARENERLKFNLTHETTFDRLNQLYKNIENFEKAWFEYSVTQAATVAQYLIRDAKCVVDDGNYSALANLMNALVKHEPKTVQRQMLRAAIETLVNNGAKVDAEISNASVSKDSLSKIKALHDAYTARTYTSWEDIFKKQGWCRSEEEYDKIEEEINLKLIKVLKELAELEKRASEMELAAESDEDEMYVEGFKLGIKERERKDVTAVFFDTLKKYNKLKIVGSTTPVLYCAAEFGEGNIVRLLLEKGAKVPCVKKDENGTTDVLDMTEKKEWKDIQTLLRQAYRKNNVQPVSKPAVVQESVNTAKVAREEGKAATQCKANRMKLKLRLKYGDDDAGLKCPSGGYYTVGADKNVTCDKHP